MALQNGAIIAERYRLRRHLATGGMGAVWEAVDLRLDREVAVKILKPEYSDDPEFLERFRTEARTTAQLNHPGIAGVFDYGETADPQGSSIPYLVMELVRGEPLNAVIRRMGTVPPELVLDMLEQSGRALQAAHRMGLVHRDVKPGNILITPAGEVKITDFGIAKAIDAAPVTRTGMVMGTVQYIAPEQAMGQEATAASDVYSLGVIGYETLVGTRPFQADTTVAIAQKQIGEAPPPMPATIPAPVRELIDITLTKEPGRRYRDGGEFAAAVAAVRAGRRPPRPVGAAGPQAQAGPATAVMPPTMAGAAGHAAQPASVGPAAVGPAAATAGPPPKAGWSTAQKFLAWSAAIVLLAAAMITGGVLFADSIGGNDDARVPLPATTSATTAPPRTTTAPPRTTTHATTTTPPTTTHTTTTTTTPTTTTGSKTTTTTTATSKPTSRTSKETTTGTPSQTGARGAGAHRRSDHRSDRSSAPGTREYGAGNTPARHEGPKT